MAEQMDDELKEKLKAALWFSIGKIVDSESQRLNTTATPQFIGTLTEMVWTQIENIAIDLETFANHAHRTTVSTEDVLLITRRNEALEGIVREFIDGRRARAELLDEDEGVVKKKKAVAGKGKEKSRVSVGGGKSAGRVEKNGGGSKGKGKGRV